MYCCLLMTMMIVVDGNTGQPFNALESFHVKASGYTSPKCLASVQGDHLTESEADAVRGTNSFNTPLSPSLLVVSGVSLEFLPFPAIGLQDALTFGVLSAGGQTIVLSRNGDSIRFYTHGLFNQTIIQILDGR